jgi:P-type Cu+ transporter
MVAIDPVCGAELDGQQTAWRSDYQDRAYYFCSADCKRRFEGDPARYADPRTARQDATRQLTVQPHEGGPCVR